MTVTFEEHRYPRNSRGAIAPVKLRRKIPAIFQASTILDSTILELLRVPQADCFPSIKLLPRNEGKSEGQSFPRYPTSISKRGAFFLQPLTKQGLVLSYYSRKSPVPIVCDYGPGSRLMNKWKEPMQHFRGSRTKSRSH